jgi:hypothetical protein
LLNLVLEINIQGLMRMREKALFVVLFSILFIGSMVVINVHAQGAVLYINPPSIIDVNKVANTYFGIDINVADVVGLWSYDFQINWDPTLLDYSTAPQTGWLQNMNFTDTASTAWVTSTTVTSGTPTYGYDSTTGNTKSGPPSYRHRANSTASQTADITFVTEQSFEYASGLPSADPRFSYAYRLTGNSITSSVLTVILVKPDASTLIIDTVSLNSATAWTYKTSLAINAQNFLQRGIYKLQLKSVSKTSAVGASNYIQVNWDDVGLRIVTANTVEGPFLKQGGSTYLAIRRNQTAGWIYITNTLQGTPYINAWPQSGSGTLVTITFKVEKLGSAILWLNSTVIRDSFLDPMSHETQDGYFSNKMPGDANGDRSVTTSDLFILGVAYGTKFGETKYDVRADFNGDESIDKTDASLFAVNYGKTY